MTILPPVAVSLVIIFLARWRLNLLALPDETAFSLGAAPKRERALILLAAIVATAAVVAVGGLVGWIGLIVPHVARRLVGVDGRRAVPASMWLGGVFALLSDNVARTVRAGEIPLGIITSLAGALVFAVMFATRPLGLRE
jgi:iron complex transport system permease protein